jgi:hypothetical protein
MRSKFEKFMYKFVKLFGLQSAYIISAILFIPYGFIVYFGYHSTVIVSVYTLFAVSFAFLIAARFEE